VHLFEDLNHTASQEIIMEIIIPDRETAKRNGWAYQVQWIEEGHPCFIRCKTGAQADAHADKLRKEGAKPVVTDLQDILQLH
jgi:hypothetical protein